MRNGPPTFLEGKALERSTALKLFKDEFTLCDTMPDQRVYFLANAPTSLIAYAGAGFYDQKQDENMYGTSQSLPAGWYLRGLKVHPEWRRAGIARELTKRRLSWLAERTNTVFVFLNNENRQ
jgi:GNAT superfamily N-acetyltransferase